MTSDDISMDRSPEDISVFIEFNGMHIVFRNAVRDDSM